MSDEKPVLSEHHSKVLDIVKAWLPVFTVCVTALWGLYTYQQNQFAADQSRSLQAATDLADRQAIAVEAEKQRHFEAEKALDLRRIELQKPFLDRQLAVYIEFNRIIGELITAEFGSSEWDNAVSKYKQYRIGEVALVEDEDVQKSNEQFVKSLQEYTKFAAQEKKGDPGLGSGLGLSGEFFVLDANALATALRQSIQRSWSVNLGKSENLGNQP